MNTRTLLPALLVVQLVIAACMVDGMNDREHGRSLPSGHDVERSFGFDCLAWKANAQFARRAPGAMGAWSAVDADPRNCMN